jgi:acyl-CoA thioester hydrolase
MPTSHTSPISTTAVRVRYADTDKMGVAYYANYLVWFEVARTEWLRDRGWTYREMETNGVMLPVITAHCEYLRSSHYDDLLTIQTTGVRHSPVRVEFTYEVFKADNTLSARGSTMHAAVDVHGRPCRLPGRVREVFQ